MHTRKPRQTDRRRDSTVPNAGDTRSRNVYQKHARKTWRKFVTVSGTKTILRPITLHGSCHVPGSFCDGIELCSIACTKLVPEKSCSRLTDTRASFLYQFLTSISSLTHWDYDNYHYDKALIPALRRCFFNFLKSSFRCLLSCKLPTGREGFVLLTADDAAASLDFFVSAKSTVTAPCQPSISHDYTSHYCIFASKPAYQLNSELKFI